jgi:hypothetical protein
MANTITTRAYAKSEFTAASGNPNVDIFAEEVAEASLSLQPYAVHASGGDIVLEWSDLPVAADFTAIDALVAAHTGGVFASEKQSAIAEGEDTNATTTESIRVSLDAGQLPPGDYLLSWSCELGLVADTNNAGAQANFYVIKNGGSAVERGQATVGESSIYDTRGSVAVLTVKAGESYSFELRYRRIGATSTAKIRSARVYLKPF